MSIAGLNFDAASHTYQFQGRVVPGVTQILQPLVDFSRVPPAVLEAKRDLGTRVHEACQFDDEDDLDEASVQDDVRPYLQAWRKFRLETGAEVIACEQRVFDAMRLFAGTLDRVIKYRGVKWVVDIKTALATPSTVGPQTAAYLRALNDFSVIRRAAIRLRPDGSYRLDELTDPNDWAVFNAALTLHNFKEKHRDD